MKIVYLPSTLEDLEWMRSYYTTIFPEGAIRAREHLKSAEMLLCNHPRVGHPTDVAGVQEFSIQKTPFSIIYRVNDDCIEILRVWDNRGNSERKIF